MGSSSSRPTRAETDELIRNINRNIADLSELIEMSLYIGDTDSAEEYKRRRAGLKRFKAAVKKGQPFVEDPAVTQNRYLYQIEESPCYTVDHYMGAAVNI